MGHTMAEKILADHAGLSEVFPGQFIDVKCDLVMANDVTAPLAIKEFHRLGVKKVFNPEAIALVASHFVPAKDIASAENARIMRDFSWEQGLKYYFEAGKGGIEHALLPQEGLVAPGEVVAGGDSHTCTYGALGCFSTGMGSTDVAVAMATGSVWMKVPPTIKVVMRGKKQPWVYGKDLVLNLIGEIGVEGANYMALEYSGDAIDSLPMEERFTISNMATEAQGKVGLFDVDQATLSFISGRVKRPYKVYKSDADAEFIRTVEIDISDLEPVVAFPFLPSNTHPLSEAIGRELDQAFIGSCTNGWITDLRIAAQIMKGKQVHPRMRCIVIPATQEIYKQALREGLVEIFTEAGCAVSSATCGPCLGGYMGVLGAGERCISTSNRNFPGRMGHRTAEVYLANPAVVAASAIAGHIAHPAEV